MITTYENIEDIKKANADMGNNFFSPSTMKWFGSKVLSTVYHGRFFITSEQDSQGAWGGSRRYTVRECIDGSIHSVSEFGEFDSLQDAKAFARDVNRHHISLGVSA